MKRYRVFAFDFDSRPSLLKMEINDLWEENVKDSHKNNRQQIFQGLMYQFGLQNQDIKTKNFMDLGNKPVSILAYHNKFLEQIRVAFVVGAYYPALVAACTLGERILNHLIKALKEDFRSSPYYKKVRSKESFDKWETAISVLESWDILLPSVVGSFRKLEEHRHKAVHFTPLVDSNDRSLALEAILKLQSIIGEQFSAFGPQPWFITSLPGEIYIKKEYESHPFIQKIYLPNCHLVGPSHFIDADKYGKFIFKDEHQYKPIEISDDEFVELRKIHKQAKTN